MKWLRVAVWALLLIPAACFYVTCRVLDVIRRIVMVWAAFFGALFSIIVCNLVAAYARAHTPKVPTERAHLNILLDKSRRMRRGVR